MKYILLFLFTFNLYAQCTTWSDYITKIGQVKHPPKKFELENPRGVFILIHGLNTRPEVLDSIGDYLYRLGFSSIRVSLKGHRGSIEEMKQISVDDWKKDVKEIYCLAKKEHHLIYGLAYSLGSLLIGDLLKEEKAFKKAIFISPAFEIHTALEWLSPLRYLYSGLLIPSQNVEEYRAYSSTSIAAYRAMFNLYHEKNWSNLNKTEAYIFINPNDELISFSKTIEKAKQHNIRFFKIEPKETTTSKTYHHLIVDQASMGEKQWRFFQLILGQLLAP